MESKYIEEFKLTGEDLENIYYENTSPQGYILKKYDNITAYKKGIFKILFFKSRGNTAPLVYMEQLTNGKGIELKTKKYYYCDISFCRKLNYYIDSLSKELEELENKIQRYKNLM